MTEQTCIRPVGKCKKPKNAVYAEEASAHALNFQARNGREIIKISLGPLTNSDFINKVQKS
jgi:hypothetical protein